MNVEEQMGALAAAVTALANSQQKNQDKIDTALQILSGQNVATKQNPLQRKHALGTPAGTADHRPLSDDAFWQDCALDPAVINRIVQPLDTIMNMIPSFPTIHESHKYAMLTGNTVTATPGQTPPTDNCQPCRTIDSAWSACKVDYPLGRVCRRTKTLESNELIRRACMRLYDDFLFVGELDGLIPGSQPFMEALNNDSSFLVTSAVRRKMWELGRFLQELDLRSFWIGDPTGDPNDMRDYWGISSLIRADYHTMTPAQGPRIEVGGTGTPAPTQAVCAAMNSDLKDFNTNCIGSNVNILYWLEQLEHSLYRTARGIGALPVDWVVAMSSEHWSELVRILPCARAFMSCAGSPIGGPILAGQAQSTAQVTLDGATVIAERDRMMSSGTLALNGRTYPVVVDDFLPVTTGQVTVDGQQKQFYQGDIWFIPLRAFGRPVLFYEHMDYSQLDQAMAPIGTDMVSSLRGFSDGGKFHNLIESQGFCWSIQVKHEKRLVLLCPSLSGRLMNVRACPLQAMPRAVDGNNPLGTAFARQGVMAEAPAPTP